LIYAVQASRAASLSVAEISAKHGLALPVVLGLLKSTTDSTTLLAPYALQRTPVTAATAVHMYWLGFIASCGRLYSQTAHGTLVLAIHPDDAGTMDTLLADLTVGHSACEFADSNLSGRQAYIRNPGLVRVLLQWGVAESPELGSIPLEYIPAAVVPDFIRGYIEGSRTTPPFGGANRRAPSPESATRLTLMGTPALMEEIRAWVRTELNGGGGTLKTKKGSALAEITFATEDTRRIFARAYRSPARSLPRASKFVDRFSQTQSAGSR